MKLKSFLSMLLLGLTASAPIPTSPKLSSAITGDYLEVRTASVFCGACHYNGELVTTGHDAVLAWSIAHGTWNGVDLTGVRAMADIAAEQNLLDTQSPRRAEIVVDTSATDVQANAMVDMIRKTGGATLGVIASVHRTAISFRHDGGNYDVSGDGFADMTVQALPNNECCSQPHLVWYTPLMQVEHRKVGYTQSADYTSGKNSDTWQREDENSAFYGSLNIPSK